MIRRFEDLDVWQVARELAKGVYQAAQTQKVRDDYPLMNQMKRAAFGISSNIAEGYERGSRKQHIEFAYIAKGSAGELRSQVIIARDAGLLDEPAYSWFMERCDACSRKLSAYIRSLQESKTQFPGVKYKEPERTDAPT